MTELKPCPFCGAPGATPHFSEEQNNSSGGWGEVYCTRCSCEVKGPYVSWIEEEENRQDSTEAAISAWNTRAAPKVKPLVWIECKDGTFHDPHCQYELETDVGFWRVTKGATGGGSYVSDCSTLESAKAAAQADYERRILDAME